MTHFCVSQEGCGSISGTMICMYIILYSVKEHKKILIVAQCLQCIFVHVHVHVHVSEVNMCLYISTCIRKIVGFFARLHMYCIYNTMCTFVSRTVCLLLVRMFDVHLRHLLRSLEEIDYLSFKCHLLYKQ